MANILVVAPHPDDETLGCGATLLKHKAAGDTIFWAIVTQATEALGYGKDKLETRDREIETVSKDYGFKQVFRLGFTTTQLDMVGKGELVNAFSTVFKQAEPNICYLPFPGDAHSDHLACFDAAMAMCKWFRYPSVKQVLVYETLSETHMKPAPWQGGFQPNYYADVSAHMDQKIAIMKRYEGEMGMFPFPRSEETIRALATVRGSECGAKAAEAFMLLKQVW
ncbi:MAG: PIG-L deacetylase family protein [Rickettsiales bacterium]|nr:PIG-L deacetylase family protein [Rickettsiales bacterium]